MNVHDANRILNELGYDNFIPTSVGFDRFRAILSEDNNKIAEIEIQVVLSESLTIYKPEKFYNVEEN